MNDGFALLLGIVQGLTEFLPVSSSGHLVLLQHFLAIREPMVFFDVMVHLGTLFAVVFFFRRDIGALLRGLFGAHTSAVDDETWSGSPAHARRYILLLLAASVPAGIAGILLEDTFNKLFENPVAVSVALMLTGGILMLSSRARQADTPRPGGIRLIDALLVGVAQALAITPGISRSGATISVGLLLGLARPEAARFSFLMSLPAILGATLLQLKDGVSLTAVGPALIGGAAAFLTGILALKILTALLRRGRWSWFGVYCWTVGAAALAAVLLGL